MGKSLIILLFMSGCAPSLHTVYRDDDRGVFKETETGDLIECQRSYSSWNGEYWIDFYGSPCQIKIKRRAKEIRDDQATSP